MERSWAGSPQGFSLSGAWAMPTPTIRVGILKPRELEKGSEQSVASL